MNRTISNLALVGVAVMTVAASPTPHGPVARETRRSTSATTARPPGFPPSPEERVRLLLALPKHRSGPQRRSSTLARPSGATTYRVIDLQKSLSNGLTLFYPLALNDSGVIVGLAGLGSNTLPYKRNADGTGGILGDEYPSGDATLYPFSINDSGQTAVGFYATVYSNDPFTTYYGGAVWTLTGAHGSSEGTTPDRIYGVANQNIGVGGNEFVTPPNGSSSLQTNACGRQDVDARAINDAGLIGGNTGGPDFYSRRAMVMTVGGCPSLVPNLRPGYSNVVAVNKHGDLLIEYYSKGPSYWKQGRVHQIPLPAGTTDPTLVNGMRVVGMNASDAVVGWFGDTYPPTNFLYEHGKTVDLATLFPANSGWQPVYVYGINDNGEIIGEGYKNGNLEGFALVK